MKADSAQCPAAWQLAEDRPLRYVAAETSAYRAIMRSMITTESKRVTPIQAKIPVRARWLAVVRWKGRWTPVRWWR